LLNLDPERARLSAAPADDSEIGESPNGDLAFECAAVLEERAEQGYRETVRDAMVLALSGRIFLDETVTATPEQGLRQIWEDQFILESAAAAPG
jgi:hypothetical protein